MCIHKQVCTDIVCIFFRTDVICISFLSLTKFAT
uniref:Uncharacterized protein n=1 Tax=Rhizophora mucronata TaxID=61149 RepID=A0A2P2PNQ0_RHIMU